MNFAVPLDHRVKRKENGKKKRNKYIDLAREMLKPMENESDGDINDNWHARYSHEMIGRGTGGHGNKRTSGGYQTTALLRSARILIRVLEICYYSYSSEKPSDNAGMKKFSNEQNNNNNNNMALKLWSTSLDR